MPKDKRGGKHAMAEPSNKASPDTRFQYLASNVVGHISDAVYSAVIQYSELLGDDVSMVLERELHIMLHREKEGKPQDASFLIEHAGEIVESPQKVFLDMKYPKTLKFVKKYGENKYAVMPLSWKKRKHINGVNNWIVTAWIAN